MAMDINDMKDVFMFADRESAPKMLDFIQNDLNIKESGEWNYIGYDVVSVDPDKYEYVLREGKRFALENGISAWWLDCRTSRRWPVNSVDIGWAVLSDNISISVDEAERIGNKEFWDMDEHAPQVLIDYCNNMKEYLHVHFIKRTRAWEDENKMAFVLSAGTLDFEGSQELLREYIRKYGLGPFDKIETLTYTGDFTNELIIPKRRKIKR